MGAFKKCGCCRRELPRENFHRGNVDGLQSYCKACIRTKNAEYHSQTAAEKAIKGRMKRYGLDRDEVVALLARERCDICDATNHKGRGWAFDHDHVTGRVRGVLCSPCNRALGLAKDDPEVLRRMAEYLERRIR